MNAAAQDFFAQTTKLRPANLCERRQELLNFASTAASKGLKVALITSGGTTVPLELNTVRFIDNFSTGTRGALCTEEFLKEGYAVIFLHRKGSNFPFATNLVKQIHEAPLELISCGEKKALVSDIPPDAKERLLAVGFTTIFEYLFLLRECSESLQAAGADALIMLAAAVSDFYVPETEMATEKIQSRAHDGLTIQLKNVPKLLGAVRIWAPQAFIISFKLETNQNILLAKAAGSLQKYGVDVVCSNLLQTIRDLVTVIEPDPASTIQVSAQEIAGDESEEVKVTGVLSNRIERGSAPAVDALLVQALVRMHRDRVAAADCQAAKRQRTTP
eukprot:TRINITY_DN22668_c0_g1_i1.p1 TRINITY_DN22668_c0_g1~~TRINITY_DN22668_c0_g1_i1.p1  ORF type:complete len:331 (-),score=68.11 TRINITY_DN22668_c0_g1_i1:70-1062(-)